MYRQQVALIINLLMLMDGVIIILGGYGAAYIRYVLSGYTWSMDGNLLLGMILFLMFVNNFVMGELGLYSDKRIQSFVSLVFRVGASVFVAFSILSVALLSFKVLDLSRAFLAIYAGLVLIGTLGVRSIMEAVLYWNQRRSLHVRRILIIGSGPRAQKVKQALMNQKSWGHRIVGLLKAQSQEQVNCDQEQCLGSLDDLCRVLTEKSVDEVIFALEPECAQDIRASLALCEQSGVSYKIIPALYDPDSIFKLRVEHIQGIPTLTKEMTPVNAHGLMYKRILDWVCGLFGLAIFCLLYPLLALAIKLDSSGPVLFRQKRVGQNGRIFYIYKFRTMYVDAEERKKELMAQNEMQGLMFKMHNDPRITRVGRFLRKTSLDEIPQFINVIKGEMSLVGTRPPTLEEVDHYETWHRRRISMKPGITGLWQVSGRNKVNDFNEVIKLDLKYIDQWRFVNDIKIIFQTIWVVLRRKGAV